jgi:hypothetical protein
MTVERTVVVAYTDQLNAELGYLAATRARDSTELCLLYGQQRGQDRAEIRQEMIRTMSTSRADRLAIDQLPGRHQDRGHDLISRSNTPPSTQSLHGLCPQDCSPGCL